MQNNAVAETKKPLMAVEFTDISGQKMKTFFTIKAQRRILKCIEKEVRRFGIIPEAIHKYLLVGGGKIDLRGDKDFKCLCQKPKKPEKFFGRNQVCRTG